MASYSNIASILATIFLIISMLSPTIIGLKVNTLRPPIKTMKTNAKNCSVLTISRINTFKKPLMESPETSGDYGDTVVFVEDFEGEFPGEWYVEDLDNASGFDYWGDDDYRAYEGNWSCWCAKTGEHSEENVPNSEVRLYDNYMGAVLARGGFDARSWDVASISFYTWYDIEEEYDYLYLFVYDGEDWHMIWEATGSTNGEWRYVDIRVPDEYLNTDDFWLAFYFYSDMSIYFEGAYLDYIQVKTYDIGLLDYNLNTNITNPGEAFEISYYIDNSSPYNIEVGLGAALRDPNGNIIYDHENDVVVTVPANSTVWAERLFKMPSDAVSGSYDLQLTLWSGDPWNSRLWHDSGWISNAIELESNEYFYDVTINPLDSDGDGYNDGLEIEMDVDTTDGTLMVTVAGYLVDSNNNVVNSSYASWQITGDAVEYGYLYVYVPNSSEAGNYHVDLYLYDDEGDLEDYYTSENYYLYPPGYQVPVKKWTFIVYLDGDNNLEDAALRDLNEMERVGSNSDINILVLFDPYSGYGSYVYYIVHDEDDDEVNSPCSELGEVNMGDPSTLALFTEWAIENFPAEHYVLVVWDHGNGWKAHDIGETAVCSDDTDEDILTIWELEEALENIYEEKGVVMDIIAFDACLMGMFEVGYQVKDYTKIMVASEETVPGSGYPYDAILLELVSNPSMSPEDLSRIIVEKYMEFYGTSGDETLSALDLDKASDVANALDNLAYMLIINVKNYYDEIYDAWNYVEYFHYYYYNDLYHYAQLIQEYIQDVAIQQAAVNVMDVVEDAIIAEGHGSEHSNAHGISIYLPAHEENYFEHYEYLKLSQDTRWDDFIRAFLNPEEVPEGILWYCTVSIEEGEYYDYVVFGEATDSTDSLDNRDVPNPPPSPSQAVDIYLATDLPSPYDKLWEDWRKGPSSSKGWILIVHSYTTTPITITLTWSFDHPENFEYSSVILRDDTTGCRIDMMENSSYQFTLSPGESRMLKIVCGSMRRISLLSRGWNLISVPTGESISLSDLLINYNGEFYTWEEAAENGIVMEYVYGWAGSRFEAVNSIDAGKGYWVYVYEDCELWVFVVSYSTGWIASLQVGWNLIGLPSTISVSVENLWIYYNGEWYTWSDAVNMGLIVPYVYGWQENYYILADVIEAGLGYWIYANVPCLLYYQH